MSKIRFVGLDVHANTIAVAVAEPGGEVRSHGVIPNRIESVRKLIGKLGPAKQVKACYEAGPTGYVLYWQLTQLGVACEVIAPSLVPTKAGGSCEDGSPRCGEAGTLLSSGRTYGRVGAGCGA
jgi:transposase